MARTPSLPLPLPALPCCSPPVALTEYDAIICNTVVVHRWFRDQVEAWGLSFLRKLVW